MRSLAIPLLLLLALPATAQTNLSADDLALVDCRLPPKQRRIGGRTYTVAGKAVRTTAVDCRIRGGDYTAYDRGNYANSLKVWLAAAEKGDHDAEYYVGKIYEGVLGTPPDYKSAALWYQKAADANHSASQFALGSLYEKGLGVPEDGAKAFKLYRQAAGLPDNYIIVESGKYEALEQAAEDLALRVQEIDELQRQLDELRKQQTQDEKRKGELQKQLDEQKRKADAQKADLAKLRGQVRSLAATAAARPAATPATAKGTLGKFYALVIGNSQYERLAPVPSAERDAKAMAAVLREQYGFDVTLLLNAKSAKILSTLYELSQSLAENDNLIVFYAGHGKRDLRNRRGWWLAADAAADAEARTNWIPNQEVSDRLSLIPARHILVLADASYVGDITRGAPQPEPQNLSAAQWAKYVDATRRRRARLALSSGADEPAAGANGTSPFTASLIEALMRQQGVFPASRLHRDVVNALTGDEHVSAVPTYAPLQSAFHDGVDFLFERK
ncbi:MAG TPA: caspase family protein [Thermoanaerobaculia bacterium]|jgi:TPR repeat protein|nr:caspase family protein [Thermoanaerobaculia bacterium]